MSTPSSSRVRVAPYLASALVAAVAFMLLAILDQRETFLPLFGLGPSADEVPALSSTERAAAETAVQSFLAALSRAYADGSKAALPEEAVATPLRESIALDLAFAAGRHEPPLALSELTVRSVVATPPGFSVETEELWAEPAGNVRPSRLRYRYVLSRVGGRLIVDEMSVLLPEPRA